MDVQAVLSYLSRCARSVGPWLVVPCVAIATIWLGNPSLPGRLELGTVPAWLALGVAAIGSTIALLDRRELQRRSTMEARLGRLKPLLDDLDETKKAWREIVVRDEIRRLEDCGDGTGMFEVAITVANYSTSPLTEVLAEYRLDGDFAASDHDQVMQMIDGFDVGDDVDGLRLSLPWFGTTTVIEEPVLAPGATTSQATTVRLALARVEAGGNANVGWNVGDRRHVAARYGNGHWHRRVVPRRKYVSA